MVTPAAPRSRITWAALTSIFFFVSQRFVGVGPRVVTVAVGTVVPPLAGVMQRASAAVPASAYYGD